MIPGFWILLFLSGWPLTDHTIGFGFIESKIQKKISSLSRVNNQRTAQDILRLRDTLIGLALENIESLDQTRNNEALIERGLDEYVDKIVLGRIRDPCPCCRDYPGIWPFCKRKCP